MYKKKQLKVHMNTKLQHIGIINRHKKNMSMASSPQRGLVSRRAETMKVSHNNSIQSTQLSYNQPKPHHQKLLSNSAIDQYLNPYNQPTLQRGNDSFGIPEVKNSDESYKNIFFNQNTGANPYLNIGEMQSRDQGISPINSGLSDVSPITKVLIQPQYQQ